MENNDQYGRKKYFSTVVLLYDERIFIDIREIKIEVCINTASGKPRLEDSDHTFEVCWT